MVKLLDSCVMRNKVQSLVVDVPQSNERIQAFFTKFGFKASKDESKTDETQTSNNITMECNIKIFRQTIQYKVKQDLKKQSQSKSQTNSP